MPWPLAPFIVVVPCRIPVPLRAAAATGVTPPGDQTSYGTQPANESGGHRRIASSTQVVMKSLMLASVEWLRPYSADRLYDQKSLIAPSEPNTKRKFDASSLATRGPPSTLRVPTEMSP